MNAATRPASPSTGPRCHGVTARHHGPRGVFGILTIVILLVTVTACQPDYADPPAVSPGIVATTPAGGGQAVPTGVPLVIRFSGAMNQGSVTVSTSPVLALGTPTWINGSSVSFTPSLAFAANTTYVVTVNGSDNAGQALPGPTQFSFTTAPATAVLPSSHPRLLLNATGAGSVRATLAGRLAANDPAAIRFKDVIDDHLFNGATLISDYRPWWGALLGVLTGNVAYCTDSVNRIDAYVAAEEAAIAANRNPDVAGDSYLHVGAYIGDLALVWDWCSTSAALTTAKKNRWSAFVQQSVWNVWHPTTAVWGTRSAPWSGWGTDNPRNNYYLSFVTATLLWGAAATGEHAQAAGWLADGRQKVEVVLARTHTADTPGGGSLEGTGYGSAMKGLWFLQYLWQASTGQRWGDLSSATQDWIRYIVASVVPSGAGFAPIGDQSRVVEATFTDYQREMLLSLAELQRGRAWGRTARQQADSFLPQMERPEEWVFDFLYGNPDATPPAVMPPSYHSPGTGHVFTRTSTGGPNATWLSFLGGPYVESHAHHDALSIMLNRNGWLVEDAGINSHSGLIQAEEAHALVMLENGTTPLRMTEGGSAKLFAYRVGNGFVHMGADVGNLYPGAGVTQERELVFVDPGIVVMIDRIDSGPTSLTKRFQLPMPVPPTVTESGRRLHTGSGEQALDVFRTYPEVASTAVQPYTALAGALPGGLQSDFVGGHRVSTTVTGSGRTEMVHVLATGGSVTSAIALNGTADERNVHLVLADGRQIDVWFSAVGRTGALRITDTAGADVVTTQLVPGVVRS